MTPKNKPKPPNAGKGRKRGTPNVATRTMREVMTHFVQGNSGKVQSLFDRVAKNNPKAAMDIYLRSVEFVMPKLIRTELQLPPPPAVPVVAMNIEQAAADYMQMMSDPNHPGLDLSQIALLPPKERTVEAPAETPHPSAPTPSARETPVTQPAPSPHPTRVKRDYDDSVVMVVKTPEEIARDEEMARDEFLRHQRPPQVVT